jgi:hypothetical protein
MERDEERWRERRRDGERGKDGESWKEMNRDKDSKRLRMKIWQEIGKD